MFAMTTCAMTHSCMCCDWFLCAIAEVLEWYYEADASFRRAIHTCDLVLLYLCHDSFICVPWLIHVCAVTQVLAQCDEVEALFRKAICICAMTHSRVCHDHHAYTQIHAHTYTYIHTHANTWVCVCAMTQVPVQIDEADALFCMVIHVCSMTSPDMCSGSFTRMPWLTHTRTHIHTHTHTVLAQYDEADALFRKASHMWTMTHLHLWHDLICAPWVIHMCAMTQMLHSDEADALFRKTIHTCAMTHLYVCHAACICVPWLRY